MDVPTAVDPVHFCSRIADNLRIPNNGQTPHTERHFPTQNHLRLRTSGRSSEKTAGHAFSFASRCIRILLAFGRESDLNSNCSSLVWPASCPSSSYPRRRDKRISRNAVAGKTRVASASEMRTKISLHD